MQLLDYIVYSSLLFWAWCMYMSIIVCWILLPFKTCSIFYFPTFKRLGNFSRTGPSCYDHCRNVSRRGFGRWCSVLDPGLFWVSISIPALRLIVNDPDMLMRSDDNKTTVLFLSEFHCQNHKLGSNNLWKSAPSQSPARKFFQIDWLLFGGDPCWKNGLKWHICRCNSFFDQTTMMKMRDSDCII